AVVGALTATPSPGSRWRKPVTATARVRSGKPAPSRKSSNWRGSDTRTIRRVGFGSCCGAGWESCASTAAGSSASSKIRTIDKRIALDIGINSDSTALNRQLSAGMSFCVTFGKLADRSRGGYRHREGLHSLLPVEEAHQRRRVDLGEKRQQNTYTQHDRHTPGAPEEAGQDRAGNLAGILSQAQETDRSSAARLIQARNVGHERPPGRLEGGLAQVIDGFADGNAGEVGRSEEQDGGERVGNASHHPNQLLAHIV